MTASNPQRALLRCDLLATAVTKDQAALFAKATAIAPLAQSALAS
ncbi:hypothetical protein [Falsiroseomonas sp.]